MSLADMLGTPNLAEEDEDEAMDRDASSNEQGSGSGSDPDEGEGVDLRNDSGQGDSSEEEDEGSDAEREVRSGFIEDGDESSSRKKKRRKHKREGGETGSKRRRKDSDDDGGDLDEDDLMLMEENTGKKLGASRPSGSSSGKLKRLRRHRSESAGSDVSIDKGELANLFDDDQGIQGGAENNRPDLFDDDEMAGFISDDTGSDSSGRHGGRGTGGGADSGSDDDEDDRAVRKLKRKAEKLKKKIEARANRQTGNRRGAGFGIGNDTFSAETWNDVTDVFGNGQDYAFAMEDEADSHEGKELADIFEPSEMAARLLTDADNLIRDLDIPERMQLASAGLPSFPLKDGAPAPFIPDLEEATRWMSTRISTRCTEEYVMKDADNQRPTLYPLYLDAVQHVIRFINVEFLEVPFIYHHRSDFLVHYDQNNPDPRNRNIAFLNQEDLWNISTLCIKYRALNHRREELRKLWDELEDVEDEYFETLFLNLESVEEVADLNEWVAMKYFTQVADLKDKKEREAEEGAVKKMKRATRESGYLNAKKSIVTKLADQMAVTATQLADDFITLDKTHFADDPLLAPLELAENFAGGEYSTAEVALSTAKMILVTEISRDPQIKKEIRRFFQDYALVSVKPTDKGVTKIDEQNPFYAFKYLQNKPLKNFQRSAQFLEILAAEADGLVTSTIFLGETASEKLLGDLQKLYHSDLTSAIASAWNDLRTEILKDAIDNHLIPAAEVWARNTLRDEEEEFVGKNCAAKLASRIDVAPYRRSDDSQYEGDVPSILSVSHGGGDPKRDSIIAVFIDSEGHLREHIKLDDLGPRSAERDPIQRQAFVELLRNRRPQVIVVGGFSPSTKKLMGDIQTVADEVSKEIVDSRVDDDDDGEDWSEELREKKAKFETIFVYDDVARIYQNSKRAATEFVELSKLGRYCVGLARYAQSPLNEYAALGADISAISYDPHQKLLNPEKVLLHLERSLVEVVNKVGVDVNRAIRNPYYYHLLPYVSGLGPRKANRVAQKAIGLGGTLTCRSNLVVSEMMTKNIFMNSAAFLRVAQDDLAADLVRATEDADVLDDTRIHPEDYEIARKMAADAMEYDEDDLSTQVASQAVIDVMEDDTTAKKLDDLSLDDFASELFKILDVPKRLTLYGIRAEMKVPFSEKRSVFKLPSSGEVFTMLTGETQATLDRGLIVPVKVSRIRQDGAILVRLDSGIEGTIAVGFYEIKPRLGETVQALVMDVKHEDFTVDLSTQPHVLEEGDASVRSVPVDTYFQRSEADREQADKAIASLKGGRQKRLVNHPNFHNQNAGEAEHFLRPAPRGDCVIRPSSRDDHLAITWKVDEGVFQHIAVTELDKASEHAIGSKLLIDNGKYTYTDLDEVIEMHVKQMARKVEEMMRHDKYKGSQDQLSMYLMNHTAAFAGSSAYGFGLDRADPKHAGQFVVSFKASDKAPIQSWPIKVVPGAFSLLGEDHGDVVALCNAFKIAYLNRVSTDGATSRTPMQIAGRTALYHGGSRTPLVKTANPYGSSPALAVHGRATPLTTAGRNTPRSGLSGGASPYPQTAYAAAQNLNIPQQRPPPPPPPPQQYQQHQQQQQYPNNNYNNNISNDNNNNNNNHNQWGGQRGNYQGQQQYQQR